MVWTIHSGCSDDDGVSRFRNGPLEIFERLFFNYAINMISISNALFNWNCCLCLLLQIQEISFKNYYTAYLTVRVLKNEAGSDERPTKWFTCVRDYCLMSSPHTEGGSQDFFSIYRQQVSSGRVHILLHIPSVMLYSVHLKWSEMLFFLHRKDLKCVEWFP